MSEMEFLAFCKNLKIYPTLTSFENVKRVILRSMDSQTLAQKKVSQSTRVEQPKNSSFKFPDFVSALKILAKVGYKDTREPDDVKFNLICQYIKNFTRNTTTTEPISLQKHSLSESQNRVVNNTTTTSQGSRHQIAPSPNQVYTQIALKHANDNSRSRDRSQNQPVTTNSQRLQANMYHINRI